MSDSNIFDSMEELIKTQNIIGSTLNTKVKQTTDKYADDDVENDYKAALKKLLNPTDENADWINFLAKQKAFYNNNSELSSKLEQTIRDQYQTIASGLLSNFQDKYTALYNTTQTNINTYTELYSNFTNVNELYNNYRIEESSIKNNNSTNNNDILTKKRLTYYKNQNITSLDYYYAYILGGIYFICILCYCGFFLFLPSLFSWKIKIVILIFLFVLPFIAPYFLDKFLSLIYGVYSILPNNVNLRDDTKNNNQFINSSKVEAKVTYTPGSLSS